MAVLITAIKIKESYRKTRTYSNQFQKNAIFQKIEPDPGVFLRWEFFHRPGKDYKTGKCCIRAIRHPDPVHLAAPGNYA